MINNAQQQPELVGRKSMATGAVSKSW